MTTLRKGRERENAISSTTLKLGTADGIREKRDDKEGHSHLIFRVAAIVGARKSELNVSRLTISK